MFYFCLFVPRLFCFFSFFSFHHPIKFPLLFLRSAAWYCSSLLLCCCPCITRSRIYTDTLFSTTFRPFPSSLFLSLLIACPSLPPRSLVHTLLQKASLIVAGIEEPIPSTSSLASTTSTHQTPRNLHHVSSYRRGRIGQSLQRCREERGFAASQVDDAYR